MKAWVLFARWVWNIIQALDRLLNAVLGGTDKEYLSSRCYRYRGEALWATVLYLILNMIEKDHCEKAYADAQTGFDPNDAVWK